METRENLKLAIAEAIRFVDKAMALKNNTNPSAKDKAEVKRSSLDLSYALQTLRKEGVTS
jgi:hypothetical protein